MTSYASKIGPEPLDPRPIESANADRWAGYVLLIQRAMEADRLSLRRIELKTQINRARLGRILHREQSKRHIMTIFELQCLLDAVNIDPVTAILEVELIDADTCSPDSRFAGLATMLSTLMRGLPQRLSAALGDIDGMDGTEIRKEWGGYFQRALISRMVQEVQHILERRAKMQSNGDAFL